MVENFVGKGFGNLLLFMIAELVENRVDSTILLGVELVGTFVLEVLDCKVVT